MSKSNLVVKTNQLNSALQNLSLPEIRIIQLAIIDARETNTGLSTDKPLRIDALRYAEVFETTRQNGYQRMKDAEENLFNRRFSYIDERGKLIKSRWVQQVTYLDDEGAIELVFTLAVVNGISRIDGAEDFFTSYLLEQTASMDSIYSVRLYELLVQWVAAKNTPLFELNKFRDQLGIEDHEYKRMGNFKLRVLDLAVKEINEKSDIKVSYTQVKKGRTITGFKFVVYEKLKTKTEKTSKLRDVDTADMFTIDGLSDKQLWRISRHKEFISTYSGLAKGDAGKNWTAYSDFIVGEIKKDVSKFSNKRPIREYLDGNEADYDFSR